MQLKKISLLNFGPVESFFYDFRHDDDGKPIPVVLVGKNGSGKSTILSLIVSALLNAKQIYYDDTEVERGTVYRLRSGDFIKKHKNASYSRLDFQEGFHEVQMELRRPLKELREELKDTFPPEWEMIPEQESDFLHNNFRQNLISRDIINSNCMLYFPPDRFEEPAWLNTHTLMGKAEHSQEQNFSHLSGRKVIVKTNLHLLKNWILDIAFDSFALETSPPIKENGVLYYYRIGGRSTKFFDAIKNLLHLMFPEMKDIRIGISDKRYRRISLMDDEQEILPNIFGLSSGESVLFTLFCSILRDFELTRSDFQGPEDIKGIVLIDEVEMHMHSTMQRDVLPSLLKFFPNVQFILTTHSPLFLLGMRDTFGDDGFEIVDMPNGVRISAEDFSEFESAYDSYRETRSFKQDIQKQIEQTSKPIVFMEGQTDIDYVKKAAEILGEQEILDKVKLADGEGGPNLKKIWETYKKTNLPYILQNKILLLFDCDFQMSEEKSGSCTKYQLPYREDNLLKKGIENLLPKSTVERIYLSHPRFFKKTEATMETHGEKEIVVPEKYEILEGQKRNLCDFVCKEGTQEDFKDFKVIFDKIREMLSSNN